MTATAKLRSGLTVARANLRLPERPDRLARGLWAMRPFGTTALGAIAFAAARSPGRAAIIDDGQVLTYRELWSEAQALASALQAHGVGSGSNVGLIADNSAFFVRSFLAIGLSCADVTLLNTSFAAPQLKGVAEDEGLDLLICGNGYQEVARASGLERIWDEARCITGMAGHPGGRVAAPQRPTRTILLTSGTTGRPRGAARAPGGEAEASRAILGRIPLRHGGTRIVAPPLFHGWGLTHLLLGLVMGSTIVLRPGFDPEEMMRSVDEHRADVLVVVPVMLQRVLELPPATLASVDTSSLRILASSGSALPPSVAEETLRRFGPVLYNVYGSTEVAIASIATPSDLRGDPATAGRPADGVRVALLDHADNPVRRGAQGRVFVRGAMQFEGYTTGGGKDVVDGMMSTGDLGRMDQRGRLYIVGREDDMIVSGGENVYPREIEDLLAAHPAVAEVAVVGVRDEEFGEALKACVVPVQGASLDAQDVKEFVRAHLARYQVPRHVIVMSELPRNAMGKVLRRELVK